MAITETSTITQVTVLRLENAVQVCRRIKIIKDGDEVLSERDHYDLYPEAKKAEFLAAVEGAENYLAALGWNS